MEKFEINYENCDISVNMFNYDKRDEEQKKMLLNCEEMFEIMNKFIRIYNFKGDASSFLLNYYKTQATIANTKLLMIETFLKHDSGKQSETIEKI